jgi:hypothetical protein
MPKRGRGQGRGQGTQPGGGAGRIGGRSGGRSGEGGGMGGGGFCVCPTCGQRVPHRAGMPCLDERCPKCHVAMVREGSPHHQEIESRRAEREPVR